MERTEESTSPATVAPSQPERKELRLVWLAPHSVEDQTSVLRAGQVIGRGNDADLVVKAPRISRRHAQVDKRGLIYFLRDLESKNGTFFDGERRAEAPLRPGTVVRLGGALAIVCELSQQENASFREIIPGMWGGHSLARALANFHQVAKSDLAVVIEGETGCGKEITARAVHQSSARSGKWIAVNCAAVPENLAESELFGVARGAFSGAAHRRNGYLKEADGGTLFLDEVLELPAPVQAKMLRALQEKEVVRLGETSPERFDARLVVAVQGQLTSAAEDGSLRRDFIARLQGAVLRLPPVRERKEDTSRLFRFFLDKERPGIDVDAVVLERLALFDFPLNVRQVQQLARQMVILAPEDGQLRAEHLPEELLVARNAAREETNLATGQVDQKDDVRELTAALEATGGNVRRACALIEMPRAKAYRIIKRRGMTMDNLRNSDSPPAPGDPD